MSYNCKMTTRIDNRNELLAFYQRLKKKFRVVDNVARIEDVKHELICRAELTNTFVYYHPNGVVTYPCWAVFDIQDDDL